MAKRPKLLLIMRHAEKSDDPSDPDLTPEGLARAERLADYIPAQFGAPDRIFASALSKHSSRPYETVEPLSKKTGVAIDATIADQDYPYLSAELLKNKQYEDQTVVVCWHHGNIPTLMRELGAKEGDYPRPWDHTVFNLILKVAFEGDEVIVAQILEPF